jgi:phospholipid/cholesterol/gamma-HCH transport system substrate-binding protein
MTESLKRWQAGLLGCVVLLAVVLAVGGLVRVGAKQGLWVETIEITVQIPESHDISPGTPVRIRGIDSGHVTAVEYPTDDGPGANITLRMNIQAKFANRLYSDATVQVYSTSLLGSKVIAIQPGSPSAGPLVNRNLTARPPADTATKIGEAADEIANLAKDTRSVVKRTGDILNLVEKKNDDLDNFVKDGRETLRSVKHGTDAVQSLPFVRDYVTDAAKLLVRPECLKEEVTYKETSLFEPNTAMLTHDGKQCLAEVSAWLKGLKLPKAEVVVVAAHDPASKVQTAASAVELTRKQAEVVLEFLQADKSLKTGWFSSRKATPLGLGQNPSPVVSANPLPASYVQVLLFIPK